MKKDKIKVIITFQSMSDAIYVEKILKAEKVKGRLIPVPRKISSGCGIAWCSDIELKEGIIKIIGQNKANIGEIFEM
ncbi:DUF3343 domain-containing protein [Leptotrichia sp. OH3620_COT-345]|uniref:DUF3343 domain-containing protein n=1 Tax=Leptotrichia sp. OH3620_COT-345 TaxID=2491048 RepID=UPI000F64E0D3|nr:DUF3343 domain-containing protein [Leptotrichia sp. OH3620_COT-345]RRD40674.1 DUF3343 domain-containing protein [Leptotrichia sp. OH3620_COT-345]